MGLVPAVFMMLAILKDFLPGLQGVTACGLRRLISLGPLNIEFDLQEALAWPPLNSLTKLETL
jgi:hypothetical protein